MYRFKKTVSCLLIGVLIWASIPSDVFASPTESGTFVSFTELSRTQRIETVNHIAGIFNEINQLSIDPAMRGLDGIDLKAERVVVILSEKRISPILEIRAAAESILKTLSAPGSGLSEPVQQILTAVEKREPKLVRRLTRLLNELAESDLGKAAAARIDSSMFDGRLGNQLDSEDESPVAISETTTPRSSELAPYRPSSATKSLGIK